MVRENFHVTSNRDFKPMSLSEIELHQLQVSKKHEAEQQVERIKKMLETIPTRFLNKSFDDFKVNKLEQGKIKKIAICYVDTFRDRLENGISMIWLGNSGTGKTLLSAIVCNHLARNGFVVRYQSSLQFLRLFQEKKFESYAAFQALLDVYKRIHFLVIDEVTESFSRNRFLCDWEQQLFFELIDLRYQHQLCTLVISNRYLNELNARLSLPTVNRLMEKGIILGFNWGSYRK